MLLIFNQSTGNLPYGYLREKLKNRLLKNIKYFCGFILKYVAPYNPLVYHPLRVIDRLYGHLDDYFNPNFQSNHIFENSRESIIRNYEINASIIEPPYNKMYITSSCLFLKGSKKRLILLVTLHLLPLSLNVKQAFHLGVICSGVHTEISRNKTENFRVKIANIYRIYR